MNDTSIPSHGELLEQVLALQKRIAELEVTTAMHEAPEQALRESEERFRVISEQSMMGILMFQGGVLRYVNEAYARIVDFPVQEIMRWPAQEGLRRMIHPDDYEFVVDQLQRKMRGDKNVITNYPMRLISRNNEVRWVEIYSKTVMVGGEPADLVTLTDITDRKRAEDDRARLQARLLHTQKLESLGLLAGGVAHDFNNLLCGVLGSTELAIKDLEADHPARASMEEIYRAAEQATELCRQMLSYAGHSHPKRAAVDLDALIQDMTNLFHLSLPKSTEVELRPAPELPSILADASQLRQVILNLVTNASEALEGRAGTVVVETGIEECTHEMLRSAWLDEELPEGSYVYVEVRDQGRGMDRETLARIFDPFFSTKFAGRGLGLASTLGIIRGHQGSVEVRSRPSKGTNIRVRFPTEETRLAHEESERESGEFTGGGAILVVEDEETVRLVTQRMLENLGFVVMGFGRGEGALAFFSENSQAIRLAIVDLNLPDMGGEQVLARIREKNPELPVLLTSGFDEEEAARALLHHTNTAFLPKPFGMVALKEGIGRLLAEPEPESEAAGNG